MDSLQSGPTFEDLSINDELSQLERVVLYSSSSIALQRLVHVKVKQELEGSRIMFISLDEHKCDLPLCHTYLNSGVKYFR